MSNVVSIFKNKHKAPPVFKEVSVFDIDVTDLVGMIMDWAEDRGIDLDDVALQVRVTDLTAQLRLMAAEAQRQQIA